MSRSETRTKDAWRSFDLWATLVPLFLAVPALIGWFNGGKERAASCCAGAPAAVVVPPVVAPIPAPAAPVPEPVAPTPPVATAPVIDCAKITDGVTVPFATASAQLTDAGRAALDATMSCLNSGQYEIGGHTDADGSDASNQRLSEARAQSAVSYLVSKGVAADRLTAKGFGETTPVGDNSTATGKAQNRRITFRSR